MKSVTVFTAVTAAVVVAATLGGAPRPAAALEDVDLVLNWVPTADHSPYYYAKAQGWYEAAGIDLAIETGKGSGVSAQRVGAGMSDFGIADMATALLAKSKGANLTALMVIYANSPQGFYWLKSTGINGPADFPGHKIGNPPSDASRVMWPAFAQKVGIAPDAVSFVNVSPQAKMASLKSGAIDVTTDFYNEHDLKVRQFGDDLGFVAWRDVGINPYGNAIIVNADYMAKNPAVVKAFTEVSQKAFAACVADVDPCLKALLDAASGLDEANQRDQWMRVKELMRDPTTTGVALGAFDDARLRADYEMVKTYFEIEQPFDIETAYTNDYLSTDIKMPAE
ncbi:nitrate ABC transporter substrate-binding protein [Tistrella bauzanensis]|uniref:Nitrate ABC transporter substrate-binding protein n=2 Tax=Tistrella bauzanensis TaxID=657419 RepID=A0ABQ1IPA0_9PROT|nr:ABC transporter substrate-binding protein [Tistrella bauzanensis]GGB47621.1 nitrate ABC transporter substrate-binding protein [Tistrella bauzanensis]